MSAKPKKSALIEKLESRCMLHGGGAVVSINAGGGALIDSFGESWVADKNFTGGTVGEGSFAVAGTEDDAIYYTRRFGSSFSYSIPVADGNYELELRFAEGFWTEPGKRKFNVKAEGQSILNNYDILSDAAPKTAVDKSFSITITDGKLDLQFTKVLDNAIISAIELNPLPPSNPPAAASNLTATATSTSQIKLSWKDNSTDESEFAIQRSTDGVNFSDLEGVIANTTTYTDNSLSPNTKYYYRVIAANDAGPASPSNIASATTLSGVVDPAVLRINAAGGDYTDTTGYKWSADKNFTGGTVSNTPYDVISTVDDSLYYTRRVGTNFNYSVPISNGNYTLKLFFADPFWTEAGKRKFNVTAEGKTLLSNYDLVADGGSKTALIKEFNVTVADGKLDLNFARVTDNAIISGIALFPASTTQPGGDTISWQNTGFAKIPDPKTEAQAAVVNGKLYVFGGFNSPAYSTVKSGYVYDPAANSWGAMADMPEPISHGAVAVDGTTIWVVAGWIGIPNNQIFGTKHVWKYDTLTNAWSAGPQLPLERGAGAAQIIGRELHFFGGTNLGRTMETGDHWVLNLDNQSAGWSTRAPLPLPRNHLGSAALNGKIYAIGGSFGHGDNAVTQSIVQAYDPATDTWTRVADLPISRSHIYSSTFVMNGKIVVAGGDHLTNVSINNVTAYDPATNKWTELTPLPSRRMAPAVKLIGDKIIAVGGSGEGVVAWDQTWVGTVS